MTRKIAEEALKYLQTSKALVEFCQRFTEAADYAAQQAYDAGALNIALMTPELSLKFFQDLWEALPDDPRLHNEENCRVFYNICGFAEAYTYGEEE